MSASMRQVNNREVFPRLKTYPLSTHCLTKKFAHIRLDEDTATLPKIGSASARKAKEESLYPINPTSIEMIPIHLLPETIRKLNMHVRHDEEIGLLVYCLPEGLKRLDLPKSSFRGVNISDIPKSVTHLSVRDLTQQQLVNIVKHLPRLESLEIISSPGIRDLSSLSGHGHLKCLKLHSLGNITKLPRKLSHLLKLSITLCNHIEELPEFRLYPELRKLSCRLCNNLKAMH